MEQGSESWLEWRNRGIGASDAPVIMGVSPWKTPYQLWEEKMGVVKGMSGNWATRRGNDLEPLARKTYELMTDLDMPPVLAVHPVYDFMRASLDGYNFEARKILEIKCPGREDHAKAVAGQVPLKYIWQLQHQLLVTGALEADYFSFDGENGVIVTVKPDEAMQDLLVEKCSAFWACVTSRKPPELTDRDFVKVTDVSAKELVDEYVAAKRAYQAMEERLDELKAEIIAKYGDKAPRVMVHGLAIVQTARQGSIDYSAIPELRGVELEQYRKKPSKIVTLTYRPEEMK